jgi:hypothetical protein
MRKNNITPIFFIVPERISAFERTHQTTWGNICHPQQKMGMINHQTPTRRAIDFLIIITSTPFGEMVAGSSGTRPIL